VITTPVKFDTKHGAVSSIGERAMSSFALIGIAELLRHHYFSNAAFSWQYQEKNKRKKERKRRL
jgi:hypothetical protein